jgi:hypothetical protein
MRFRIFALLVLALISDLVSAVPAYADNPCQYIGIVWRYGSLSMKAGHPIVHNEFGTYVLSHDDDVDWTKVETDTGLPPNDVQAFGYSYDQWTPAQKAVLEFPGGPRIEIKEISIQSKENPQLWNQTDQFELSNGTISNTVQLEGMREFGHAYRNPLKHNLIYLMPQDSSREDASCGPDDGPGLVELDVNTLEARILFKRVDRVWQNAGVWSIQITSNTAWMLTSTGVCRGDLKTEQRVCWSYAKGIVKDPGNAHPFIMGRRYNDNRPISMAMTNPVKVLGGRKPGFDEQFFIEIEPSAFYKSRNERIYLDRIEIEPILTKQE